MRIIKCVGLVGFFFLPGRVTQAVTVIDFEDWTGGSGTPIVSRGYTFHGGVSVVVDLASNNPTSALRILGSGKMIELEAKTFDVISLDVQEGVGLTNTVSIRLDGSFPFPGGGVVQTFNLDGDPTTYERLYPSGFVGVEVIHFYAFDAQGQGSPGGLSVDNIVVPEPGALGLIMFGLMATRRGQRRPA